MILHADELGPAVLLGAELHHGELVGPHAARADVAHLAAAHEVVQRQHRLLDRDRRVEPVSVSHLPPGRPNRPFSRKETLPMDLKDVDVRRLQSLERGVDRVEDCGPRKTWLDTLATRSNVYLSEDRDRTFLVNIVPAPRHLRVVLHRRQARLLGDGEEALGQDDDLMPRDVELLERFADDALGVAGGVDVGRVPLQNSLPTMLGTTAGGARGGQKEWHAGLIV